jgi:putative transposase
MGLRDRSKLLEERCFFITTSCYRRQYLLDETCFKIIIENMRFYNHTYKAQTMAYVFMVNHIHFIVYFGEENKLTGYMRDFKKYTALKIREYFAQRKPEKLVALEYQHREQPFKVWEDRYDDVCLYSREVCETKIKYMHNNPVKAGLVNDAADYRYSSAAFYLTGNRKSELLDYREVF